MEKSGEICIRMGEGRTGMMKWRGIDGPACFGDRAIQLKLILVCNQRCISQKRAMVDALKLIAGEGCFFKLQVGGRYHAARYLYNVVQGYYIFCQFYGIVENALHASEHGIQHLFPGG